MGIRYGNRAVLGTDPACRTFGLINVARPPPQRDTEIPGSTRDFPDVGVCNDLYVGRPTGLHELGRQYSDGAVVGRKRLVQTGHDAADGR